MDNFGIYNDIANRTNGDIYIGVVGPVRTGKSTFITKFMENFVIPNISERLQKQIAVDEMPQSASGKGIMTTQPKFIPANAVNVKFNNSSAKIKLIDCVGYSVKGATGQEEDGKPRMVKTPWQNEPIPFEKAGEIGTTKVITDYSTVGILVTCDGSFGELSRESYLDAENKCVKELKKLNKPFIILLNSSNPKSGKCQSLAEELENKYNSSVVCCDVTSLNEQAISNIMEKLLLEFPMYSFDLDIPSWMQILPSTNKIVAEIIESVKDKSKKMTKMKDYNALEHVFDQSENVNPLETVDLKLGEGKSCYKITAKEGVYFKVLSEECGEDIKDDYSLMSYIKSFSSSKKKFEKIKSALESAESNGYGVVFPTADEMNLEEPVLVKQGGKYGVKLKASAPSLHIMKVDVNTEVSPIVGTEKQGEDLVDFIMEKYQNNPSGIWETNMFGKSLNDLVNEGLNGKLNAIPKDTQTKMQKTLTRIVNENKGGIICILL